MGVKLEPSTFEHGAGNGNKVRSSATTFQLRELGEFGRKLLQRREVGRESS